MEPNWQLVRKRSHLEKRARIVQAIRAFFIARNFLEVETPHRIPGNAPETNIDAVVSGDWFLQTSPELCMKRLLAAGYPQLFQICRCWREGERGIRHLPEYTMLEWYRTGCDYEAVMTDCETLLAELCPERKVGSVDLTPPWDRLTVAEAFARYGSKSLEQALATDCFDEMIALEIEPQLGKSKPTFLTEYPATHASLARKKPENAQVAERFELYINGLELANAYSELTDSAEQRHRFEGEEYKRRQLGKSPYLPPEKFLCELDHLTEAAGIALGVDRLVMLLVGAEKIDDVVAFTPEDL